MALDDYHKHFAGEVAQKAFIKKDGKILLVQYPEDDQAGPVWDFPGGRFHNDESALDGLTREIREELGAEIRVDGPMVTGTFHFTDKSGVLGPKLYFVVYRAALVNPDQTLVPEEGEIATIKWFEPKELFGLNMIHHKEYMEALKPFLE